MKTVKKPVRKPGDTPVEDLKARFHQALGQKTCLCRTGSDPKRELRTVGKSTMSVQVCQKCNGLC